MKRKYISLIIFIIGLGILLYPWVARIVGNFDERNAIEEYDDMVDELSPELEEELIDEYEDYNSLLTGDGGDENFNGKLLGTIEIPKLRLKLPIYQGASVENLRMGAGHISGTSLPTGELGTNSVLAGHNRFRGKELFTNINKLVIGDIFKIDSLGKKMDYSVVKTIVVEPYETDYLMPEEGKDKVTLLTCTHFGKKRFLVIGERKQ